MNNEYTLRINSKSDRSLCNINSTCNNNNYVVLFKILKDASRKKQTHKPRCLCSESQSWQQTVGRAGGRGLFY